MANVIEKNEAVTSLKTVWSQNFKEGGKKYTNAQLDIMINNFKTSHPFYKEVKAVGVTDEEIVSIFKNSYCDANTGSIIVDGIVYNEGDVIPKPVVKSIPNVELVQKADPLKEIVSNGLNIEDTEIEDNLPKPEVVSKKPVIEKVAKTEPIKKVVTNERPGFYKPKNEVEREFVDVSGGVQGNGSNSGGEGNGGNAGSLLMNSEAGGKKLKKSNLTYLVVIAMSVFVSIVISLFLFVKAGVYNTDVSLLDTKVTEAQKAMSAKVDDGLKKVTDLSSTFVTSAYLKTVTDGLAKNSDISSINNSLTDKQKQLDLLSKSIGSAISQSSLDKVSADVSGLSTKAVTNQTDIAALKKSISDMDATITTLKTQVKTLTDAQTSGTSTSSGTGTVATNNLVTATIAPNEFTSQVQSLDYSSLNPGESSSKTFSIRINNQTGKTINNIKLALGFNILYADGQGVNTPITSRNISLSYTLMSDNYINWQEQNTGLVSVIGYANSTNTGFMSDFGNLSQSTVTKDYNQTLTLTYNGAVSTTSRAYKIYPFVKVVDYQVQ